MIALLCLIGFVVAFAFTLYKRLEPLQFGPLDIFGVVCCFGLFYQTYSVSAIVMFGLWGSSRIHMGCHQEKFKNVLQITRGYKSEKLSSDDYRLLFITMGLTGPIIEELLFRAPLLLLTFVPHSKVMFFVYLVVTSVVFSLMHEKRDIGEYAQLFLAGICFGSFAYYLGIGYAIALHMLNNILMFFVEYNSGEFTSNQLRSGKKEDRVKDDGQASFWLQLAMIEVWCKLLYVIVVSFMAYCLMGFLPWFQDNLWLQWAIMMELIGLFLVVLNLAVVFFRSPKDDHVYLAEALSENWEEMIMEGMLNSLSESPGKPKPE